MFSSLSKSSCKINIDVVIFLKRAPEDFTDSPRWRPPFWKNIASSVPKGCKSGFVTYRHHVVQQAKLQLVVKYCFWLVMFYPIKICS